MSERLQGRLLLDLRQASMLPLLALLGCGADSAIESPSPQPIPVLLSVTPDLIVAGSGATTLTVSGSNFVSTSRVRWNGGDRVTRYRNAQTLTVDLLESDVAVVTTGTLMVVTGPPGGGTSGDISVIVGHPTPAITNVTPNSSSVPPSSSGQFAVTVTGRGFVPQSQVRLATHFMIQTFVSPTQIVANIPNLFLGTPGVQQLTVTNPAPGGGTSNAVDFTVVYPAPSITSLSPDSTLTGTAFTLTVLGSGYGPASVVRWNGAERPTTFVNVTRLTAAIPADDVAEATVAAVSVSNPAPGGGTSNTVSYRVREAAPILTAINPAVINAGAATTTVTLTGLNFRSGATVQWKGQDRASMFVSGTTMSVTLTQTDLALVTLGELRITNPGASGVSNSRTLLVVAPGASMSVTRTITLAHSDLVYDESRGVFYASVPGNASQHPNSVVRIDPATGTVTGTVNVGSNPGVLAISDGDQYLFAGLLGTSRIVRIALGSFSTNLEIPLPTDPFAGSTYAEDIVPISGAPQTIAVSTFYTNASPRNAGTLIIDNATPRVAALPRHTGANRITRGPTNVRLYGYNNESTEFGFRSIQVATHGLFQEAVKSGLVSGFGTDIEYSGGYVYATTGEVVDPVSMLRIGAIPATGIVRPDAANARVHLLSGMSIRTYHYTAFSSIGTFTDAALASHTKLVRWGSDGLAVGGGASIVLLRGSLVGQ